MFSILFCIQVHSLLAPIQLKRLYRMHLHCHSGTVSVDTILGRAAHVSILDSTPLVNLVLSALHDVIQ
jgi:hypothetical protein